MEEVIDILAFDFHLATQWNLNKHECLWLTICELKRRHDKNRQKCFYIKGFPKELALIWHCTATIICRGLVNQQPALDITISCEEE
jgi:hypothetical protein